MDKISRLLGRSAFCSRVFFNDSFCGTNRFLPDGKNGHLHLILEGSVQFLHEMQPPLVVRGPALMFYPGGYQHELYVQASARLVCAYVQVEGGTANRLTSSLPDYLHAPLDSGPLAALAGLIGAELAKRDSGQDLVLDRLCDLVVVELIRLESARGSLASGALPGLLDERLSRVLAAVHAAPAEPWTIDTLAAEANMSRSKFAAYFRSVIGVPPGDYVLQHRVRLAKNFLRQGLSVKSVGLRVGYANQPAFSRMFSSQTGRSPREWVESQG